VIPRLFPYFEYRLIRIQNITGSGSLVMLVVFSLKSLVVASNRRNITTVHILEIQEVG
jgi:hypothetical protein